MKFTSLRSVARRCLNGLRSIGSGRRVAVYTAIFGDYDHLIDDYPPIPGVDFHCFTDSHEIDSRLFKVHRLPSLFEQSNRDAKIFKVLPHVFLPSYDYSLWIDGRVRLLDLGLPRRLPRLLRTANLCLFQHPDRHCAYAEAEVCRGWRMDDPDIIDRQMSRYESEGFPRDFGLFACTVLARRHHAPALVDFNNQWWAEIVENSRRDQLSFPYLLWKNGLAVASLKDNLWQNGLIHVGNHKTVARQLVAV